MTKKMILTGDDGILLKALLTHFRKGTFLRDLSIVMTGTATALLISFAMMPIVSRFFTPADFGIYGSYSAVLGVLAGGVTLQYAQAIVLPKHKEESINLLFVSVLAVALVFTAVAIFLLIFPRTSQNVINAPNGLFLVFLLIAVIVTGLNQTFQAWCIRVKAFKHTSASQAIRSISSVIIWITAGFGHLGAIGLVLGAILADILASFNLWRIVKSDLKASLSSVAWKKMKQMAHEFRDFPMFAAPQNLTNALSVGLPVLLLGYFYGIGIAGAYAFGVKIIQTPMALLLTPLRQVLLQKANESNNQGGNLYSLFMRITGGLIIVALVPFVILFIWSPQIFSIIFGDEWVEAGIFARWLLLWNLAGFSYVPAVIIARILRKQRNLFLFDCLLLLTRTAVLVFGGMYFTSLTTVISFSVVGFIFNVILIGWIWSLLHSKIPEMDTTHG